MYCIHTALLSGYNESKNEAIEDVSYCKNILLRIKNGIEYKMTFSSRINLKSYFSGSTYKPRFKCEERAINFT